MSLSGEEHPAPTIDHVVTHGTFELDGGSWEVDNNIWLIGDGDDVIVIDAAHDAGPIIDAVRRPQRGGGGVHARPQRPRDRRTATRRGARRPGADESGRRGAVANDASRQAVSHLGGWRGAARRRHRVAGDPHARALPRLHMPVRAGAFGGFQRRHPVPGRAGCDRPVVFGLPDDPRVDLREAGQAARRHRRLHRPRRHHHDRRRVGELRRVGRRAGTNCRRSTSALDCCPCRRRTGCRCRRPRHPPAR